ncbi:(2Fe-2S)-binding protein [Modestobacter sp. VKM Ac-2985]|uniref:(2Fe-2S)-binding protein n=1 Tax=Modestobacter sp. VKM Ac-2985 TaxID=3004139 RepID=UPI0022AB8FD1|nr:(2Fe-2S)-binding protein [Modestobacter sp. VKM Ac-2985]MCZ2836162.1 (2Fe-2S)-binding protein [Modestobacter sp. VKM Ac-2985]
MSDDGAQALVVSRLPGAAALGLLAPPSAVAVPGPLLADPAWTAEVLAARAVRQRTDDRRVLATVWWYSVSSVLLTPVLAGLVTGVSLSARLADTTVHALAGGVPVAATTRRSGGRDVVGDLRTTIGSVVAAVAEAGGTRERPLWAIATDSLANRLLALGRAVGDEGAVTALAGPLAAAIGEPLPAPRYVDVGRPGGGTARFTRRASCCLLYRVPHEVLCTSCPRRDPGERQVLLEDLAERM